MSKDKKDFNQGFSLDLKEENIIIQKKNTATGYKNWGTVLLNSPIIEGTFYCEIEVLEPEKSNNFYSNFQCNQILPRIEQFEPHVRIGIGSRFINFDRPLGSQPISYSFRDIDGSFVHDSNLKNYGQPYKVGDTIGILVHMFPPFPLFENFYEDIELYQKPPEENLGSYIIYFKNGKTQGIACQNLKQNFYHIGVSLYMNAKVQVFTDNKSKYFPHLQSIQQQFPLLNINNIQCYDKVNQNIPDYKGIIY